MNNLKKKRQRIAIMLFVLVSAINISAQTTVPIDESHFPDEGFRNYVNQHATPDNISSITTFDIRDDEFIFNIKDLKGIEFFTSLERLYIQNCNFKTVNLSNNLNLHRLSINKCHELNSISITDHPQIDTIVIWSCNKFSVANLSNNPKLDHVDFERNNVLQELNLSNNTNFRVLHLIYCDNLLKLDVSNDNKLEAMRLWGVENLPYLDVRSNTQLKDLRIRSHQMKSLDVTNNTKLESLMIWGAPITSLDVSANQKLTKLYLDTLQLTGIDLSNNFNLKEFHCTKNNITELNLSNNPALSNLDCDSNQLTHLDLSNNPELKTLDCSNNLLTSLDLQHNTKLNDVRIFMNHIKEDAMTNLINSLPYYYGKFCVIYPEGDEGNAFTYDHYKLVKSKHWYPCYAILAWKPYAGIYDWSIAEMNDNYWKWVHIETIEKDKQTSPIYNLNGQRLAFPPAKAPYIQNGRIQIQ